MRYQEENATNAWQKLPLSWLLEKHHGLRGRDGEKFLPVFCVPKSEHRTTQVIEELETDHKNISRSENGFSLPYFCSASCCPTPTSKRSLRWAVLLVSPCVGDQRDAPKPGSAPAAPSHPGITAHVWNRDLLGHSTGWGTASNTPNPQQSLTKNSEKEE